MDLVALSVDTSIQIDKLLTNNNCSAFWASSSSTSRFSSSYQSLSSARQADPSRVNFLRPDEFVALVSESVNSFEMRHFPFFQHDESTEVL
jgi:hypothetical protein